jgi:hypothetical protein
MPKFGLYIEYKVRTLHELFKNIAMPKFDLYIKYSVNSWFLKKIQVILGFLSCLIVIQLYSKNFTDPYVYVVAPAYNFDSP